MTKIVFYRSSGIFYGFEEQGHTGYGHAGDDVLCAALSAMTMLIINTVEVGYASDVDYEDNEGATTIRVRSKAALPQYEADEKKRYAIAGLILAYYEQLKELTEEYYEYLSVDAIEKPLAE